MIISAKLVLCPILLLNNDVSLETSNKYINTKIIDYSIYNDIQENMNIYKPLITNQQIIEDLMIQESSLLNCQTR